MTTGTKAWELFADTPEVIAARVDGELRDLAHELAWARQHSGLKGLRLVPGTEPFSGLG